VTTVDGFEDALREEMLDAAEQEVADRRDQLAGESERRFDAYANRHGYDLGYLGDTIETSRVSRSGNRVSATVSWGWGAALWEYGVDPHVIEGNPTLAFSWQSPPEGTRPPGAPGFVVADSVNWGSVTGGIPEARAIRTALQVVGQAMRGGIQ
jgi:hypothetical protein